eukprot:gene4629-3333_t
MKFGKRLAEEMIAQWKGDYVNYKRLKQFIHNADLHGDDFAEELFRLLQEELAKAEALFQELLQDLERGVETLLALSPHQLLEPPRKKGAFYRRRHPPGTGASSPNPNGGSAGYGSCSPTCVSPSISMASEETSPSRHGPPPLAPLPPAAASVQVTVEPSEDDLDSPGGRCSRFTEAVKNVFLRLIGDSYLKVIASNTPEAAYLEWNSNAHKLQHFAELNLEAIRKSLKKLKKHRRDEPDFSDDMEHIIARSRLSREQPALRQLMETVNMDFERKFGEPLDRYASLSISGHWHVQWRYVLLAVALFIAVLRAPGVLADDPPAHHCMALFALVMVLWLSEAIPFFCTAMLIPLVAVPLGIVSDPATGRPAAPAQASQILLGKVFNHVQILVMGGLTIGKAFAKTNIEMYAVSALHRLTAHRPALYLLALMLASCVLCAIVSNVAAPLLALSVLRHTLWEFRSDTTAPQGMLLGLAFACNLGGMLSPIASPQNAVAIAVLSFHNITFAQWVLVALPVVLITIVAAWAILLLVWRPFEDVLYIPLQVVDMASARKVSPLDRIIVLGVSGITIVLWVMPSNFIFGDTGIVALIPIVVFFGMGILSKEDFNTLSWHLMFLLAGGNMLGLCAHDSAMLDIFANSIRHTLVSTPPYTTVVAVTLAVGVVTTFVSHTVAAMTLLPIIAKIGFLMPHDDESWLSATPQSLVMIASLMCSGAMAFPISSFPNVNSLLAEDAQGKPYLRAKDFLFCGTLITLFFAACLITWMVPYTNGVAQRTAVKEEPERGAGCDLSLSLYIYIYIDYLHLEEEEEEQAVLPLIVVVESYETAQTLAALPTGVPMPGRTLRLLVTDMVRTHVREYGDGLVMTIFGSLRANPGDDEPRLRINLYNEWATAASFADAGDILLLKGFRLVKFPEVADGLPPRPPPRAGKAEDRRFFVVPIPSASVLRVIQKDPDTGVTSEVTVDPACMDEPKVRVMPIQPSPACPSDLQEALLSPPLLCLCLCLAPFILWSVASHPSFVVAVDSAAEKVHTIPGSGTQANGLTGNCIVSLGTSGLASFPSSLPRHPMEDALSPAGASGTAFMVGVRSVVTTVRSATAAAERQQAEAGYSIIGVVTLVIAVLFLVFLCVGVPILCYTCRPAQPTLPLYGARQRRLKRTTAAEGEMEVNVMSRMNALLGNDRNSAETAIAPLLGGRDTHESERWGGIRRWRETSSNPTLASKIRYACCNEMRPRRCASPYSARGIAYRLWTTRSVSLCVPTFFFFFVCGVHKLFVRIPPPRFLFGRAADLSPCRTGHP